MKRSSRELKRIARDLLNNRYSVPMGAFVTASLIPAVMEIPFSLSLGSYPSPMQIAIVLLAEFLILLVRQVLNTGVLFVHLNMTRKRPFAYKDVFFPLRRRTEHFFLVALLWRLLSLCCFLPFILGILTYRVFDLADFVMIATLIFGSALSALLILWVSLNYSFVFLLLADDPQISVTAAFRESRRLLKGNRVRLFYLLLSFIVWRLLSLVSLGFASLWISPYLSQIMVTFYLDCTGELNHIPVRDYPPAPNSLFRPFL
ncbi:MAG: DUF975 family protein [Clostridiales bacterium]|nr:DUF975 family protein [Clostridiales bacterium]